MDSGQAVQKIRQRLMRALFLRSALPATAVTLVLLGVLVLILRWFGYWSHIGYLLLFLLLPIPLLLLSRIRKQVPPSDALNAWLDRRHGFHGRLMTAAERGELLDLPQGEGAVVDWPARKYGVVFLAAVVFFMVTALAPNRWVAPSVTPPLDISDQKAALEEQISILEEHDLTEDEEIERMREQLDQIEADARGDEPGRTWEALEYLSESIEREAEDAFEQLMQQQAELEAMETVAAALEEQASALSPEEMDQGMKILEKTLDEHAQTKKQLAEMLEKMGPAQTLEDMAKAMNLSKEETERLAQMLRNAQMVDPEMLQDDGRSMQKMSMQDLKEFLKSGRNDLLKLVMPKGNQGPGEPSREGGPTDLTFGALSDDSGTQWEEQALTPGQFSDLRNSTALGVSSADPNSQDQSRDPARFNALQDAQSGGGSANTRTVLPRHRSAVKQYFKAEKKDKPKP